MPSLYYQFASVLSIIAGLRLNRQQNNDAKGLKNLVCFGDCMRSLGIGKCVMKAALGRVETGEPAEACET